MNRLRVGFIPLLDCALLVAARELGFAAAEGLDLVLVAETSWANIRDRLVVGHLDAAQMLGPMTVASTLGIGHIAVHMIAPFSLGLGGNAITLSNALIDATRVHLPVEEDPMAAGDWVGTARQQGEALRKVVEERTRADLEPLTFGMVYPFSCHNYELRYWLAASGIDPDREVRLVVIPPPLLVDSMKAGYIDGFCVGEPWNTVAVEAGVGSIVLPASAIWRRAPEKVLGCRADWALRNPELLASLLRALYRAATWCEDSDHHGALALMLANPRYVGAPAEQLERALSGALVLRRGSAPVTIDEFQVMLRHRATFPWVSHALWFYSQMVRWGQTSWSEAQLELVRRTYRPDLYRSALGALDRNVPDGDLRSDEIFFDGRSFDPSKLASYLEGGS